MLALDLTCAAAFDNPVCPPQGTPVIPGPCTFLPAIDGYACAANSSAYALPNADMKPVVPAAAGGIGGNQQLFVLESRDADTEDRNFGPVFFNVSGSIDMTVVAMDQGWCFAYTCQKRLSTFWTYLPIGHVVGINFTGTPATVFRTWLPYAAPEEEIVVEIYYMMIPNRWVAGAGEARGWCGRAGVWGGREGRAGFMYGFGHAARPRERWSWPAVSGHLYRMLVLGMRVLLAT